MCYTRGGLDTRFISKLHGCFVLLFYPAPAVAEPLKGGVVVIIFTRINYIFCGSQ